MNKIRPVRFTLFDSPVGQLLLTGRNRLESIAFPQSTHRMEPEENWQADPDFFRPVSDQLSAYFNGRLTRFDVDMELIGTEFQKKVWHALAQVPYGTTLSYGELAGQIGNPNASRAVGMANGKNPIPIIIPCHRVIGKNGSLTGFGGGLSVKQSLLRLEGVRL